ncbi:MAG: hypothetical protein C4287_23495 [Leptolyngbya sp. ERB_1_2]
MNEVKQVIGVKVQDQSSDPRPAYATSADVSLTTVVSRDNTPAMSLLNRPTEGGGGTLADNIERAKPGPEATLSHAQGVKVATRRVVQLKSKKEKKIVPSIVRVQFTEGDVCDERTFIIRTRSSDIHSEEMKRLFWANGGEKYLVLGLSYASAFANLRNDKMKSIKR